MFSSTTSRSGSSFSSRLRTRDLLVPIRPKLGTEALEDDLRAINEEEGVVVEEVVVVEEEELEEETKAVSKA